MIIHSRPLSTGTRPLGSWIWIIRLTYHGPEPQALLFLGGAACFRVIAQLYPFSRHLRHKCGLRRYVPCVIIFVSISSIRYSHHLRHKHCSLRCVSLCYDVVFISIRSIRFYCTDLRQKRCLFQRRVFRVMMPFSFQLRPMRGI
jgi:hypothetical protein